MEPVWTIAPFVPATKRAEKRPTWIALTNELLRLYARGQGEGVRFVSKEHHDGTVRSAVERELASRGESSRVRTAIAANKRDGTYVIALVANEDPDRIVKEHQPFIKAKTASTREEFIRSEIEQFIDQLVRRAIERD